MVEINKLTSAPPGRHLTASSSSSFDTNAYSSYQIIIALHSWQFRRRSRLYELMAFYRSSLLLRKALGSNCSRRAAVFPSYGSLPYNSSDHDWRRRSYSSSESDIKGTTISAAGYHLNNGPTYMRGAVFWEPNKPLTFEDFHMPRPKVNEVLIKTKGIILVYFLSTSFCALMFYTSVQL